MNKRLITFQALLITGAIVFSLYSFGTAAFIPALYGGGVALLNTLWLNRGVVQAGETAKDNPKLSVYVLYFGAVQRFVFVLVALAIGLAALTLKAEPLLLTFGFAQLAYFFSGRAPIN
jgi:hypothetical protein